MKTLKLKNIHAFQWLGFLLTMLLMTSCLPINSHSTNQVPIYPEDKPLMINNKLEFKMYTIHWLQIEKNGRAWTVKPTPGTEFLDITFAFTNKGTTPYHTNSDVDTPCFMFKLINKDNGYTYDVDILSNATAIQCGGLILGRTPAVVSINPQNQMFCRIFFEVPKGNYMLDVENIEPNNTIQPYLKYDLTHIPMFYNKNKVIYENGQ